MGEEGLRYDAMVEQALRGVVRRALSYAAERGLPGDHHFYVSFRTNDPGVDIPAQLRTRYPNEMTIVLQHQFLRNRAVHPQFGLAGELVDQRVVHEKLSSRIDGNRIFTMRRSGKCDENEHCQRNAGHASPHSNHEVASQNQHVSGPRARRLIPHIVDDARQQSKDGNS